MQVLETLAALLLGTAYSAHASPLLRAFESAGKDVSDHHPEILVTDLSLGTPWSDASQHVNSGTYRPTAISAGRSGRDTSFYPSSSSAQGGFTHSPTSPFRSMPQNSLSVFGHYLDPRIDPNFSELILDHARNRLWLPILVTYIPSPWIRDVYFRMTQDSYSRHLFDRSEVRIPDAIVKGIETGSKNLFMSYGSVYKVRIAPNGGVIAGSQAEHIELLFKSHKRLEWIDEDRPLYHTVSFWTTANHASHLALLGLFHISAGAFRKLTKAPGTEKFMVESGFQDLRNGFKYTYLAPAAS